MRSTTLWTLFHHVPFVSILPDTEGLDAVVQKASSSQNHGASDASWPIGQQLQGRGCGIWTPFPLQGMVSPGRGLCCSITCCSCRWVTDTPGDQRPLSGSLPWHDIDFKTALSVRGRKSHVKKLMLLLHGRCLLIGWWFPFASKFLQASELLKDPGTWGPNAFAGLPPCAWDTAAVCSL